MVRRALTRLAVRLIAGPCRPPRRVHERGDDWIGPNEILQDARILVCRMRNQCHRKQPR
jgi:hypothetical protein